MAAREGSDPRWKAVLAARARDGPLGMGDFRLLRRLGCGDIGTVYLSELSKGGGGTARAPWFAMKVMDKASLISRNKMARAQTELGVVGVGLQQRVLLEQVVPTA